MLRLRRLALVSLLSGLLVFVLAGGLALDPSGRLQAAVTEVDFRLTGAQEVPVVNSPGSAVAHLSFDDVTRDLSYTLTVQGLSAEVVTEAHIHRGAAGVNGAIIYPLATKGFQSVAGKVTLTAADVTDLRAGNLYVNVHSTANPDGFARAQILLPASSVEAALRAAADNWNKKNVEAFLAGWTDKALQGEFDETRAELRNDLPMFIGEPLITVRSITNVVTTGNTASLKAELIFGTAIDTSNFTFVLEGGTWKIDSEVHVPTPIPAGVSTVDLRLQEFAFVYDRNAVAGGNVAFNISNVGQQMHEVLLAKLDPNLNLQQAIMNPDGPPPPGFDVLAHAGPWPPGERTTLVFTQPLAAGRYAFLCFVPDADGTPHALKGMISEFTVTGSGGGAAGGGAAPAGGIRAPNTGDGGLQQSGRTLALVLIVAGVSLFAGTGAIAALAAARSRS